MARLFEHAPAEDQKSLVEIVAQGHNELVEAGVLDDIAMPYLRSRYPRMAARWDKDGNNESVSLGAGYYELPSYDTGNTRLEMPLRFVAVVPNLGPRKREMPYHNQSLDLEHGRFRDRFHGFEVAYSNEQVGVIVNQARKAAELGFGYLSVQSALTRRMSPPIRT